MREMRREKVGEVGGNEVRRNRKNQERRSRGGDVSEGKVLKVR